MMNDKDDLQVRWFQLQMKLAERFGKRPDIDALLFLIGIQETGFTKEKSTKGEKQDLMHVEVCSILAPGGYYEFTHKDQDGWPHFKQIKQLPVMMLAERENFLKDYILFYFEAQDF